jgi:hypothetical protein
VLEVRVEGDAAAALELLRRRDVATPQAFAVGSTLTLPLTGRGAAETLAAIDETDLTTAGVSTRAPTLDDVYLRLTGARIADPA